VQERGMSLVPPGGGSHWSGPYNPPHKKRKPDYRACMKLWVHSEILNYSKAIVRELKYERRGRD